MNLFIFGWPSCLGGSTTRLAHLALLLCKEWQVTFVPSGRKALQPNDWLDFLHACGIKVALLSQLPRRLDGWGLSICDNSFLAKATVLRARKRGLRIAWSNDMMWHFQKELGAVYFGLFDIILYVSEAQRRLLEPGYAAATLAATPHSPPGTREGWIEGAVRRQRWAIIDNFIDPASFPFKDRFAVPGWEHRPLTVGRLSRADPEKFPDDFPAFYENLGLTNPRFRVMGCSRQLLRQWKGHRFDGRWTLLPEVGQPQVEFLHSLDLFVYSLGPRFRESWGRAAVEAMLTGAVPLVPSGHEHHLRNLITHGVSGFLCDSPADYGRYARLLQDDPALRKRMSYEARREAEQRHCNPREHRAAWRRALMDGWEGTTAN